MPASEALPTVEQYLNAYGAGASERDVTTDLNRGSRYDVWGGAGAVLFARIADRARENFRIIYFDAAEDETLDELVAQRFPDIDPRVQNEPGTGSIVVSRPNTSGGAGTFWTGTRIGLSNSSGEYKLYQVSDDTTIGASALSATIPIEALSAGPASAVNAKRAALSFLRFEDSIYDPTWSIDSIECAPGTFRETDSEFRARVRTERLARRPGYIEAITRAMRAAGAQHIVLFAGDFLGTASDHGLNRVYVADLGYTATPSLLAACRKALPSCTMCGTAVQVLPMTQAALGVSVHVTLWKAEDVISRDAIAADIRSSLISYLAFREHPFLWRVDGFSGAALRAGRGQMQDVAVTTSDSAPSPGSLFTTPPLVRWVTDNERIQVSFT